jgi:hypothetical protein
MLHELMHWHESGLLRSTEPANQLVAYVWESGISLKIIPDTLIKVCLCTICIVWASLRNDAGPLSHAYALKALTHEVECNGPSAFCTFDNRVKIFDLKLGSVYARKYSVPNRAWLGAT